MQRDLCWGSPPPRALLTQPGVTLSPGSQLLGCQIAQKKPGQRTRGLRKDRGPAPAQPALGPPPVPTHTLTTQPWSHHRDILRDPWDSHLGLNSILFSSTRWVWVQASKDTQEASSLSRSGPWGARDTLSGSVGCDQGRPDRGRQIEDGASHSGTGAPPGLHSSALPPYWTCPPHP